MKYFVKHKLCVKNINSTDKMITEYHLFAYVSWKKLHRKFDWFGAGATVCESFSEFCCSDFSPVQRIAQRCAYACKFGDITENVLIECPISLKYYM